ncbi:MAG: hypothetical protein PHT07_02670 [Paludibacter sp.]|nr:hypothetical protein [Paludibacter sp.]
MEHSDLAEFADQADVYGFIYYKDYFRIKTPTWWNKIRYYSVKPECTIRQICVNPRSILLNSKWDI